MPTQLNPKSETSTVILTSTGSADKVAAALPFGIYMGMPDDYQAFASGAADQVSFVYKKFYLNDCDYVFNYSGNLWWFPIICDFNYKI